MALFDAYPQLKTWDIRILATDIDTDVVQRAQHGIYKENDLAGLSLSVQDFSNRLEMAMYAFLTLFVKSSRLSRSI